jgi:BirA family biotin operon repressor/biotin-[acetyl-CoA-carboxylase] ligase
MLSAATIQRALSTQWLGRPVTYFRKVGSTNDVARTMAREGAPEGTLVIADEQTAGRGRLDRHWWAPAGGCLLVSLVFRPPMPAAQAQRLTMIAGLACTEAVEAETGLRPSLKWPNDLLVHGRKLAGILTEAESVGERLAFVVVGLGLNVNVDFSAQSEGVLHASAIGLSQVLGHPVDRLALLNGLLSSMERRYEQWQAGVSPHDDWSQRLETLGRRVTISASPPGASHGQGSRAREGEAIAVDEDGALLVRLDSGHVERVLAGDVTLRQ